MTTCLFRTTEADEVPPAASTRSVGRLRAALHKGFTLIELLAVMAVVATLLSLAAVGVERMSSGQGLGAGVAVSEQIFTQARNLAISKGAPVRIAVHHELDDSNPENRRRYHRMIVLLQQETNKETGEPVSGSWKQVNQPTMLPSGVYFSSKFSSNSVYTKAPLTESQESFGRLPTDSATAVIYEINGQGICTTPGASFILESGARPPGQPDAIMGQELNLGGFVIWRNANTSPIRDVNKIVESQS